MNRIHLSPISVEFKEIASVQLSRVVLSWLGVVAGIDSEEQLRILTPTKALSIPLPTLPLDIFWVAGNCHILVVAFENAVRFIRLSDNGLEAQEFSNRRKLEISQSTLTQSRGDDVGLPFGLLLRPRAEPWEYITDGVMALKQEDVGGTVVTVRSNDQQVVIAIPAPAREIPVRASVDDRVVQVGPFFWFPQSGSSLYGLPVPITETGQRVFPNTGIVVSKQDRGVCVSFSHPVTGYEFSLPCGCLWSGLLPSGRIIAVTDQAVLVSRQRVLQEVKCSR